MGTRSHSGEEAGAQLANLASGSRVAPTGSYVDRDRVARSSAESYDPRREAELVDFLDQLTSGRAGE